MNKNFATCDSDRIERFLDQQLNSRDQSTFEQHLDDCEECRHALEAAAASNEIWSGVRESLPGQLWSADGVVVDSDFTADQDAVTDDRFNHDSVLKLLAPTDDDRMIGRLGSYEVLGVVGSGGMGVVLKALDPALNRYVAIKLLAPHLGSSGAARKRFSREAQAAAAVVHDNVVEIHGVADIDGLPYLVMPYVRGPSLQKRINDNGPLAVVEILRVGMQAAAGLTAAHAQGLVHRDVKPANILLADGVERVKLTDFGLARAADDASLTRTGIIAGTPQYMSPEQARGESVDQRSDLFALGSVLYTMCTGHSPFRAETSYGVLRRIIDDAPKPIRENNPDIPQWLCQIIDQLLSKDPRDRFESASQVTELLEACLAHVQQPAVVPLPVSLNARPASKRFFSGSRRVTAAIAIAAAFVFALLFWQGTNAPDIAGTWSGEGWGNVVLTEQAPAKYTGTYTDTFNEEVGKIEVKWSRIERRFNGTWSEGEDRFGRISLRRQDDQILGGWTTSKNAHINPGTPELADLSWSRKSDPAIPAAESAIVPAQAASGFPHVVQFKQGATNFVGDDSISITEVRGTSKTFAPDNTYVIKGTYQLASCDEALLAAYTTASERAKGFSRSGKGQTTTVKRGRGNFELLLPISYKGWPHVSFYAGGKSMGGNYFGTGEFVLKQWWGKKKDQGVNEKPNDSGADSNVNGSSLPIDSAESRAWQRTGSYVPPSFETFFPDDETGGVALNQLWRSNDKDARSDQEILDTVRNGLRHTNAHRTSILRWIGNKYIWGQSRQNPDAIEIMYHAADFSGKQADPYGTRHYAVYFGLSVTQPKTPSILRTLAELAIRVDDPNDLSRIQWGCQNQREELLKYLAPFLASDDEAVRAKAQVCEKIFKGELKAFGWAANQAKTRAEAKFSEQQF